MIQKSWGKGKVRLICYLGVIIVILGSTVADFVQSNTPTYLNISSCGGWSGGGGFGIPQGDLDYEYRIHALPQDVDYVKYDINVKNINCSTLYLRAKVEGEEGNSTPTNITSSFIYGQNEVSVPLYYNVTRGEYVTLFDLAPYWGTASNLELDLHLNSSSYITPGIRTYVIFRSPVYYGIPFSPSFLLFGVICIVIIELFTRKYSSLREEVRKNQELLSLLKQQNQGAYETALRRLQEDHNQLLSQIQSDKKSEGDEPDA